MVTRKRSKRSSVLASRLDSVNGPAAFQVACARIDFNTLKKLTKPLILFAL